MQKNVPFSELTTMQLGGMAHFVVDVSTPEDVSSVCRTAAKQQLPVYVLGEGSNTIATDKGFSGVIIRSQIGGFEIIEDTSDYCVIRIGSAENWDDSVKRTVDMSLTGIEALSGIPGTVGAAPVQNIGAYGQEVADVMTELEVYDIANDTVQVMPASQCEFSYRHSIFRGHAAGKYIILSVTLKLYRTAPYPPFYAPVEAYLQAHNITTVTSQIIRDAVLTIRRDKLPDPSVHANSGSFFKNAFIESWQYENLITEFPTMPAYPMDDTQFKVPSGWLIEQAGYKGKLLHGIRVHDKNALVLINESATSYSDLAAARDEIAGAVRDMFQINITQEPLILEG